MPDAVITVICASDDGWSYHPKYVEAIYRNIINCSSWNGVPTTPP
jgi:hypothetical protein